MTRKRAAQLRKPDSGRFNARIARIVAQGGSMDCSAEAKVISDAMNVVHSIRRERLSNESAGRMYTTVDKGAGDSICAPATCENETGPVLMFTTSRPDV